MPTRRRLASAAALVLGGLALTVPARGQGDLPASFGRTDILPVTSIDRRTMPPVDVAELIAQDEMLESVLVPPRVGAGMKADFDTESSGTWEDLPEGGQLWRCRYHSRAALWVQVGFGTWRMPGGARMWVYDEGYAAIEGGFDAGDMREHGQKSHFPIPGDTAVVELFWPEPLRGETPNVHLGLFFHGYKPLVPLGDDCPSDCTPDSSCDLGLGIENIKRGVVRTYILINLPQCDTFGKSMCTGTLLSSTDGSCDQNILLAGHCIANSGTVPMTDVLFNYERPECCDGVAPTDMTLSGATFRMQWDGLAEQCDPKSPACACFLDDHLLPGNDVAMIRIDPEIPRHWNIYFNGWDRSGNASGETGTIHIPSGSKSRKVTVRFSGFEAFDEGFWEIPDWELGGIASGSSGAPLFTGVGHPTPSLVTGVISAGGSACPGARATVGRVDAAWLGSGYYKGQLQPHLDPANASPESWPGHDLTATYECGEEPWTNWLDSGFGEGGDQPVLPGDTITMQATLGNEGGETLTGVVGTLRSLTSGVTIAQPRAFWPDIPGGESRTTIAPHFTVEVGEAVPCGTIMRFELEVTANEGAGRWLPTFEARVGEPSETSVIALEDGMTSAPLEGTNAWTFADGAWFIPDVAFRSDTALVSAEVPAVPADAKLRIRHRFDTEAIFGGGVLEYRNAAGGWTDAEAFIAEDGGGYHSGTAGSLPEGMSGRDAWSGDSGGERTVVMDLRPFAGGPFQFRLRFATDDGGGDVGWWIDDAILESASFSCCPGDVDGSGAVDTGDLVLLLAAWGPCAGCPEDVDGDGEVGTSDLLVILAAWGPCGG